MVIFLANQFIGNTISSGGDVLFTQILGKVNTSSTLLIPKIIASSFIGKFPEVKVVLTDNSKRFKSASSVMGGIFTTFQYINRALNSFLWLYKNINENDTIYLTGDFICNTIPAWTIKILKPNIRVVSNFYHRNPPPSQRTGNNFFVSFFSRLLQSISLVLIEHSSSTIFVLGEEGKQELLRFGFPSSKIIISGAGIDHKMISKHLLKNKVANQLIYIGRINVTKGAFDLMQILKLLDSQNPSWHCHFVGQGTKEDIKLLADMALKLNVSDKITIHGYLDEEKKYQLLATSSILLLPSKEEGFGIVIMEALALRTKVVCYDLPALKQIYQTYPEVHFVKLNDCQMFAEIITMVIKEKKSVSIFKNIVPTWEDVYQSQAPYLFENK